MITNDRPKVMSSSGTWPNLWTRRRQSRSNRAPITPTTSGAITSAGQKPVTFEIEYAMYAPIMLKGIADIPQAESMFQPDRIHPLASAHPVILANVWPVLAPMLK